MIDIGHILNDCPFRVFCTLAKGDSYDEHISKYAQITISPRRTMAKNEEILKVEGLKRISDTSILSTISFSCNERYRKFTKLTQNVPRKCERDETDT